MNRNPYFTSGQRCQEKGKKCYTREEAVQVRDYEKKRNVRGEMRIYRCMFCDYWHLTHHRPNNFH